LCALLVLIPAALVLAVALFPLLGAELGNTLAAVFIGVYALAVLAIIGGVAAALVQRLREIDKGEEDDAKKY